MQLFSIEERKHIHLETIKASDTRTPTHGLASTLRMPTATSPEQWQPWTAVSVLLGLVSMA